MEYTRLEEANVGAECQRRSQVFAVIHCMLKVPPDVPAAAVYSVLYDKSRNSGKQKDGNLSECSEVCCTNTAVEQRSELGFLSIILFTPSHKHAPKLVLISCET